MIFFKNLLVKNNIVKNNIVKNIYFNQKNHHFSFIKKKKRITFYVKWDKDYKNYELIQKLY